MPVYSKYTEEQMRGIGRRIKFARKERGLNQGQLCERARIPSTNVVSKFELGLDVPKGERLKLIADALGVSEDYIIKGEGKDMAMSTKQTRKQEQVEEVESVEPVAEVPVQDMTDAAKEDMPANAPEENKTEAVPARTPKAAAEYERKAREVAAEYERKARELRKMLGA